jgi:hypothetical protein
MLKAETKSDLLEEFLYFLLSILIMTFLIRVVWNRSLVKHITILKPINTLVDAFILAISINMIKSV